LVQQTTLGSLNDTTSIAEDGEVVHDEDPISLCKLIIRPWEEIQCNKNQHGLGYDTYDNNLHILDYSKPIKFVSGSYLDKETSSNNKKKDKCQHCNRTSHMEDNCFDLQCCHHCGKKNNPLDKCSKRNIPRRLNIDYEWIDPWERSSKAKRIH